MWRSLTRSVLMDVELPDRLRDLIIFYGGFFDGVLVCAASIVAVPHWYGSGAPGGATGTRPV
jgi:hypothetical protein